MHATYFLRSLSLLQFLVHWSLHSAPATEPPISTSSHRKQSIKSISSCIQDKILLVISYILRDIYFLESLSMIQSLVHWSLHSALATAPSDLFQFFYQTKYKKTDDIFCKTRYYFLYLAYFILSRNSFTASITPPLISALRSSCSSTLYCLPVLSAKNNLACVGVMNKLTSKQCFKK